MVTVVSIIPWRLQGGRNRWTHLLPWLALALYFAYESAMPARMNIRLDLVVISPLTGLVILAWLIRLMRIRWLKRSQ